MSRPAILQITSELDGGGVDRLLFDYCSQLASDFRFDFVVTSEFEGILEAPLKDLGCRVFHVTPYRNGAAFHKKEMQEIFASGRYDIVHDHSGFKAAMNLKLAAETGVKGRIAHAHIAYIPETTKGKILRSVITPVTKRYATDLFACGRDAANWMWGRNVKATFIMTNAIRAREFSFSEETRLRMRERLGLSDKFVIGNVARFSAQKNHSFLVDIFSEVAKVRDDSVLLLVGRGELESEIRDKVIECGLDKRVLFLGVRNDVQALMNAMDVFVLPSLYEGLPVTLVEAQANGLPAVVSNNITSEICDIGSIQTLSIEAAPKDWSNCLCRSSRGDNDNTVLGGTYDICIACQSLASKYTRIIAL